MVNDEPIWKQPPAISRDQPNLYQEPGVQPAEQSEYINWRRPATNGSVNSDPKLGATQFAASQLTRSFEPASKKCRKCDGDIDYDGYCMVCGAKAPNVNDHIVQAPADWVAGVSDIGQRHLANEDAMSIAASQVRGQNAILVVCDGVSSAANSQNAAEAAALAALQFFAAATGTWPEFCETNFEQLKQNFTNGVAAANYAVNQASDIDSVNPPSCTFAAAIIRDGAAVVGSVGDSRVYWVTQNGDGYLLTVDDSLAQNQIDAGIAREIAENSAQAHVITRWLGRDCPQIMPHITLLEPQLQAGWLVVCSDGLWNYASQPQVFAKIVKDHLEQNDDLSLGVAALVDWANQQGGLDNVTVAVARLEAAEDPLSSPNAKARGQVDALDAPTVKTRSAKS